jgi:hypothetical protein
MEEKICTMALNVSPRLFGCEKEVYHQARVAAVTSKKGLGQWLEEAVFEKLGREQPSSSRKA